MEEFLRTWSYLGIFLGILATGLGFPMPEELPIVLAGVISNNDDIHWWLMLPVCIVGVVVGDLFLYLIGRYWGIKLVQLPFVKRRLLPPDRLARISENFQKYGIKILLFARLTPGIRAPIFLTAGITKLSLPKFLLADGIYAIPGVTLLFFLGYWFTEGMVGLIKQEAEHVKSIVILVVLAVVTGYLLYRFLRKPMVTGTPEEMPPLVEQVTHTFDNVAHKIRGCPPDCPPENGTPNGQKSAARNPKSETNPKPEEENPKPANPPSSF